MADRRPSATSYHSGDLWSAFRQGTQFFMQEGDVYETLRRFARRMVEEGLDYAIIGGMALVAHGYRRFTEDIAVLMTPEALAAFRERVVESGYLPAFPGAAKSFRDADTGVRIEIVTTGEYPGDGHPKTVAYPDPADARFERDGLWLLTLEKLLEVKLASGLSAPHRLKDLADVQDLIVRLKLPVSLAESLDQSVRGEYRRLWEQVQAASSDESR